jgi:hypothetical protein
MMGTWGTGLYSDDTACDVRDDYKDILGQGISEAEATNRLLQEWKSELADPDVAPVFWLTLADVQWNLGRLQEQVKEKALTIIENGSDLTRWLPEKKLEKKRKVVLERLRQKLITPPPAPKKVKKRYIASTDWNLEDVYSFTLQSGKSVLLHVIGFHEDKGGRGPVCEILEWAGESIPNKKIIENMGYRFALKPYQHLSQFLFGSLSAKDFPKERVNLVAENVKPKQERGGYSVILWKRVDKDFDLFFELQ